VPRTYEAVYIFDSALEDDAIADKLAYPIKKRENGYYAIARFTLDDTKVLPEFERALKLDEGVLRYLISLHERELGAPPMTEEQLAARRKDEDEDEDEE